jgi:hypothetical protein
LSTTYYLLPRAAAWQAELAALAARPAKRRARIVKIIVFKDKGGMGTRPKKRYVGIMNIKRPAITAMSRTA